MYGRELLKVCHHLGKSCEHKHYDSEDMFLICHMTSRKHMFQGLCELTGGIPSVRGTTFPSLVVIGLVQVEI